MTALPFTPPHTLAVPRKSSGKAAIDAEIWRSGFLQPLQLTVAADEPAQELHGVGPDGAGNHQELNDVQPAFAAFVLATND
jgi:hypothetical protein